jgi:hypothetical protein
VDELVLAMNRAAEAAVPQARPLLVRAVKDISVEDALSLVRGGDTAVTDFFADKTRQPLGDEVPAIVTQATEKLSLATRYNAVAGRAAALGLLKGDDTSVQRYVTARALDGLFLMIGEEEKKLRADPLRAGSICPAGQGVRRARSLSADPAAPHSWRDNSNISAAAAIR